jgi:hypothetical protein
MLVPTWTHNLNADIETAFMLNGSAATRNTPVKTRAARLTCTPRQRGGQAAAAAWRIAATAGRSRWVAAQARAEVLGGRSVTST